MPPYHPDYHEGETHRASGDDDDDEDSLVSSGDEVEDDDDDVPLGTKVRRGSEGFEIRPVSREQMLRQYLESVGENYDRYIRYIPYPESEDEDNVAHEA